MIAPKKFDARTNDLDIIRKAVKDSGGVAKFMRGKESFMNPTYLQAVIEGRAKPGPKLRHAVGI